MSKKNGDGVKMVNPMFALQGDALQGDVENSAGGFNPLAEPTEKAELQIEELSDIRSTFEACDSDKSGGMDQAEFTTVLRLFGVEGDADALSLRLITEAKKGHSSQDKDAQAMTGRLLDQVGLPWDMDTAPPVMSNELNFPEFMYLVSSGLIEDNVDDWTEGSFHLRLFKSGYDIADVDGDGELTKQELSLAIGSLQSGSLTTEEFDQIWDVLNPAQKSFLSFTEFLEGMVNIKTSDNAILRDKFTLTKPNQLMNLLLDTPVAAWEHKEIMSGFVAMEKFGMKVLEIRNEEMSTDVKQTLLQRASENSIHQLHDGQREKLKTLHHKNVKQAFCIGFISCFITSCIENVMTWKLDTDGAGDLAEWNETTEKYNMLDHEDPLDQERFLTFWAVNGAALGICTAIEIAGLYYYGIINAVRVANKLDMRLLPLNRVRATVAQSLIRAALELGQANEVMFGVDPLRDQSSKSQVINGLIAVIYMAKIALTGFMMKVLIKRFMARGGAKYALPWMAVPACAGWNALVGNAIMREAKLRALGVALGIELFNELMDSNEDMRTSGAANSRRILKLQIIRAIACNIVKHRDFYPTKEVLLKHAMGYLNMLDEFKGTMGGVGGRIDVIEDFILDMAQLTKAEQKQVIKVLCLCSILDGRLRRRERLFYEATCEACNLPNNQQRLKLIARGFRQMEPTGADDFNTICDAEPLPATLGYYCHELKSACMLCMAC